jgi:tetratricopeptide (TPR) repeat protein
MLRFQTAVASVLGALFVVPVLVGQGQIATLENALSGTARAIEVLEGLEQKLREDPASALGLVLSATEAPLGDDAQRDQRLETLRSEVNLLQMELDAMQSPTLAVGSGGEAGGAVQSALGTHEPLPVARPQGPGITTGLDDSMRALLTGATPGGGAAGSRALPRGESEGSREHPAETSEAEEPAAESAYSADPLRHGITCYRAGRYAEALALLSPLDGATALYWQARTLERLERLDDAIRVMERAIADGGEGFELRRAQTDLEFLRWKRDFVKGLPRAGAGPAAPAGPAAREGRDGR